jgi:two-component system, cell cycle sensor histidine kinase and response regulator CckA
MPAIARSPCYFRRMPSKPVGGAEPALRTLPASVNEQRFAAVLEHLPCFCYTADRNLVFTSSEGAGLTGLHLVSGQLVGVKVTDLWGTNDPNYEPLVCHRNALAGKVTTYRDVCAGRSIEYRISPLRDASGEIVGVVGVGLDVTEREQAQNQEAKLAAQLRQALKVESIGQLAGGVAHDFNNLLTCILGNLTLAERFLQQPERVSKHLAEASAAAESAATLTRQLLAFGRKQLIDPRPIDLGTLVGRVQGMLARLIGESIALRTQSEDGLWLVKADPGQLEQILINLVVNARDAIANHGEVRIETHNADFTRSSAPPPPSLSASRYVVLSVTDTGRGMSEAVRAKLFEPFFTTKEMGKGTGLGLATVYGAAQQNGGTVTVDSELGTGSTFCVYLPALDEVAPSQTYRESDFLAPSGEVPTGTETILLVEDEPLLLELAYCTLQQLGYDVLPCAGPDEALRTFAQHQSRVHLLFTDVMMPRMNGKELAARITALKPDIQVIYSSGYSESVIATRGVVEAGVNYISKPYRLAELAYRLREVLDAAGRETERASGRITLSPPELEATVG